MAIKKTTKNIEPKNPDAKAPGTSADRNADRKTARKTSLAKAGGH